MKRVLIVVVLVAFAVCAVAFAQQRRVIDEARFGEVEVKRTHSHVMNPARALAIPWHVNYQGYLTDDAGTPINDTLSMTFSIWTTPVAGSELWNENHPTVGVEEGLFNVVLGSSNPIPDSAFASGETRWLELIVEIQPLYPRTEITSVGYAYRAVKADSADDAGMVDGFDASVTPGPNDLFPLSAGDVQYVNEGQTDAVTSDMILDGTIARGDAEAAFKAPYADTADYALAAPVIPDSDWTISGSNMYSAVSGSVGIGTSTPSEKLEVDGNFVVSGHAGVGGDAAIVGEAYLYGGVYLDSTFRVSGDPGTSGQLLQSTGVGVDWVDQSSITDSDWTIAGNVIHPSADYGLSMRSSNVLYGINDSTHVNLGIACTTGTSALDYLYCTVSGGYENAAVSDAATVGGGHGNMAAGMCATVSGGGDNTTREQYATVGGGWNNYANREYATVGGGYSNIADGDRATASGGSNNTPSGDFATVSGGLSNTATANTSTVGGGWTNIASGQGATVGGGAFNTASGSHATVGGGRTNAASGHYATVGGGEADTAKAPYGGVLSGYNNLAGDASTDTGAVVAGGWNNSATGTYCFVGGGQSNIADSSHATVGGGSDNSASGLYATVAGGDSNTAGDFGAVGGGQNNNAGISYGTVGGGLNNQIAGITGIYATIGGGMDNLAADVYTTVAGGRGNTASRQYATISGGVDHYVFGNYSAIGGGWADTVNGDYGFAAGREVKIGSAADYTFAFGLDFTTSTPNAAVFHSSAATFSMGIGVTDPSFPLEMGSGAHCTAGGVWTDASSREYKKDVIELTTEDAMDALFELNPVTFEYKAEGGDRYAGFIAEDVPDLVATKDRKGLSPMDIVAVLTKVVQNQQEEIKAQRQRIEALEARIRTIGQPR